MALINCNECNKEISDKAEKCPNCGNPIALIVDENAELSTGSKLLAIEEIKAHKTNHILHLALSVLTAGTWLIVWAIISTSNTSKRNAISKKYKLKTKEEGNPIAFLFIIIVSIIGFSYLFSQ